MNCIRVVVPLSANSKAWLLDEFDPAGDDVPLDWIAPLTTDGRDVKETFVFCFPNDPLDRFFSTVDENG